MAAKGSPSSFDCRRKIVNSALRTVEYPPHDVSMRYFEDQPPPGGRFMFGLARFILRLFGWKLGGCLPNIKKAVIVGYPHTSNWDGFLLCVIAFALGMRPCWLLKDTMTDLPVIGRLLRSLGAIGVNRRERTNFVDQVVDMFDREEKMFLIVAPEGTRSWCDGWKTGFYRIAEKAKVPMLPGYVDYTQKVGGVSSQCLFASGDIDGDLAFFREFFQGIRGRSPSEQSDIVWSRKSDVGEAEEKGDGEKSQPPEERRKEGEGETARL